MVPFLWHCLPSSSPRHAKAREEGFPPHLQCLFLPLSPSHLPKNPNTTYILSWPTTMIKRAEEISHAGGCTEAAPTTRPLHDNWTRVG